MSVKKNTAKKMTTAKSRRSGGNKTMSLGGSLVIVESPTKARTITKFLDNTYTVVASMGHIVELADKKMDQLVANNFEPSYEVAKEKTATVKELKSLKKQATQVILATDEDREGEAISWHLCQQLGLDSKTTKRIVFHEITESAIQEALAQPRTLDMHLVHAQQARAVLDKLVGFSVSPVLRSKVKRGLSAGRVQSVAVKLIIERENEISAFIPKEYRTAETLAKILTNNQELPLTLRSISGITEFTDEGEKTDESGEKKDDKQTGGKFSAEVMQEALSRLGGTMSIEKDASGLYHIVKGNIEFVLQSIQSKQTKKGPGAPFITSSLQQTASRYFGRPVKQVMQTAQRLYENGFITYMRTDSTSLSGQAIGQCKDYILQQFGVKYHQVRQFASKSKNAQEAHEAIRPTKISLLPEQITIGVNEQKLYRLIRQRTVASQMADAQLQLTSYLFHPKADARQTWTSNGKVVLFDGYMKIGGGDQDDIVLPTLKEGKTVISEEILAAQHFTKPPARYSEATLVKALESRGIGRPSTYASIITTIQDRGYVMKEGQSLGPTEIAFGVTDFLNNYFKDLMNYDFTADLEDKLDTVASGDLERKTMLGNFWKGFQKELDMSQGAERVRLEAGKSCPKCGGSLLVKSGKAGTSFLGCEHYPDCDFVSETDAVSGKLADIRSKYEGQPCPAGGVIIARMGRFGPFLSSSLYPEVKRIKSVKQFELDKQMEGMEIRSCPTCKQGQLVLKSSKRGTFWACNRYPDCNHAEKFAGIGGETSTPKKKVLKRRVVKKTK